MAYIDCVVDTNPMANEINTVSRNIQGTTAAVVGMRVAVIQAEAEAAEHVCNNVNKGFYTLIHSQISQKIAKLRSEVDSHLMKLNQHKKQLLAIKGRMERDYEMISSRYIKTFNSLNRSLEQRVYELDRPAIDFAVKEINTFSNRARHLSATVPVSQVESLSMSQKILASNMKFRGMKVIGSMSKFLNDMEGQKALTDRILLSSGTDLPEMSYMVPVLISESCCDKFGNRRQDVFINDTGLSGNSRNRIRNAVNSSEFEWKDETSADADVKSEFNRFVSESALSQRVKDTMLRMFQANNYQTIKSVTI